MKNETINTQNQTDAEYMKAYEEALRNFQTIGHHEAINDDEYSKRLEVIKKISLNNQQYVQAFKEYQKMLNEMRNRQKSEIVT